MSKRFLSTDMIGCPPMYYDGGQFMHIDIAKQIVYWDRDLNKFLTKPSIKLDPMKRCHAIARHLFDLLDGNMAKVLRITITNGVVEMECGFWGSDKNIFLPISINPFLHTDISCITREELGL